MRIKLFKEYASTEYLDQPDMPEKEDRKARKLRYFLYKSGRGVEEVDKSDLDKYDIPDSIKTEMLKWDKIYKSPHSNSSFYNSDEFKIDGETGNVVVGKPDGLCRVSDHWNYTSFRDNHESKHSVTDKEVTNITYITLAQYNKSTKLFKVLISETSKKHIDDVANKKRILDHLKDPQTIAKKRDFKEKIDQGLITVSVDNKKGILDKWNGREIKVKNKSGNIIFRNKDVREHGIIPTFYINNIKIEDPFKYE